MRLMMPLAVLMACTSMAHADSGGRMPNIGPEPLRDRPRENEFRTVFTSRGERHDPRALHQLARKNARPKKRRGRR